jgi:hypothetical protein
MSMGTENLELIKYEAIAYIQKRSTPKKAKRLIRVLLERIQTLEQANASFGFSHERIMEELPNVIRNAVEGTHQRALERSQPVPLEPPVAGEPNLNLLEGGNDDDRAG